MDTRNICFPMLIVIVVIGFAKAHYRDYFTGAVFEHNRRLDRTNSTPAAVVRTNLHHYARAAKLAKEQGADIIVYPEYGIFPPSDQRAVLKNYLEVIPGPKEILAAPCDETDLFSERPILRSLSCIAKNNEIVVVANMGGREPCAGEFDCPEDGELHLNTNVAFDQKGKIIGRYYKEHLFFELGMDLPREDQDPTVETNFGKFAMFICFETVFKKMVDFARMADIDALLFSTLWINTSPAYTSTQWFQAWAMGNDATLLASNVQMPGLFATGSGIFRGREGTIVSILNPDGISKLVVANVPKRNKQISSAVKVTAITEFGMKDWEGNGKNLPAVCSFRVLGTAQDTYKDYRCFDEDVSIYNLVKLTKNRGHLKVCHEGLCCELGYSASNMKETFYLGAYNGTTGAFSFNRYFWAEENCFLARCDDFNGTACSHFRMHSETSFHRLSLKAHFSTEYIYPSVMSSGMRLVPVKDWAYTATSNTASVKFSSRAGIKLLAATLKARAYDRDPPYIR